MAEHILKALETADGTVGYWRCGVCLEQVCMKSDDFDGTLAIKFEAVHVGGLTPLCDADLPSVW